LKENVLGTEDKAIIVSQWTSMLQVIGEFLDKEGFSYVSLNGNVPVKDRGAIIDKFNTQPLSQQVSHIK
jgi:transcription termination factor 2